MIAASDVPPEILAGVRSACLALPETYEEPAWVGTRWRIRKQTFAHVVMIESGWPPAYARAARTTGPISVMTFSAEGHALEALRVAGHPFFLPPWRPHLVGMLLEPPIDWDHVEELVTESYCVLAPRRLVEAVDRSRD